MGAFLAGYSVWDVVSGNISSRLFCRTLLVGAFLAGYCVWDIVSGSISSRLFCMGRC